LQSTSGKKLLAKYDSARVRLKNQKQYLEFPIEFADEDNSEQKSFFYNIDSQAFTTIDLKYHILKGDTSFYLNEEQAQSILEEGLEYQKSRARIFKDMFLPYEFVDDVYYSHKHPRIKKNDDQGIEMLDFSKIIVSRQYKISVKEAKISSINQGIVKMRMIFNYTGDIVNDYVEIKNLEIRIIDENNEFISSKKYE
jgi:hypothetical protein